MAHQHDGETGTQACGGEMFYLFADFGANLGGDFGSVEDECGHGASGEMSGMNF